MVVAPQGEGLVQTGDHARNEEREEVTNETPYAHRGDQGVNGSRLEGHIRWFSYQKRYGRIHCNSGLSAVFVQSDGFRDPQSARRLEDGGSVEFSIEQTSMGPAAVDVVVLGGDC